MTPADVLQRFTDRNAARDHTGTFGERVKAARLARGLTQYELAERLGAGYKALSRIETGTTRLYDVKLLAKLSAVLDVPVGSLVR